MEENIVEAPVVDYEKCFEFISEKTGVDKETVMKVVDAETEYLISIGVIETE